MANHFEEEGHMIDIVSTIVNKHSITLYKVDNSFVCLTLTVAITCCHQLNIVNIKT